MRKGAVGGPDRGGMAPGCDCSCAGGADASQRTWCAGHSRLKKRPLLLSTSPVPPSRARAASEHSLMAQYYEHITEGGVTMYSMYDAWEDYKCALRRVQKPPRCHYSVQLSARSRLSRLLVMVVVVAAWSAAEPW